MQSVWSLSVSISNAAVVECAGGQAQPKAAPRSISAAKTSPGTGNNLNICTSLSILHRQIRNVSHDCDNGQNKCLPARFDDHASIIARVKGQRKMSYC